MAGTTNLSKSGPRTVVGGDVRHVTLGSKLSMSRGRLLAAVA